jgi:hypothetical protein
MAIDKCFWFSVAKYPDMLPDMEIQFCSIFGVHIISQVQDKLYHDHTSMCRG